MTWVPMPAPISSARPNNQALNPSDGMAEKNAPIVHPTPAPTPMIPPAPPLPAD